MSALSPSPIRSGHVGTIPGASIGGIAPQRKSRCRQCGAVLGLVQRLTGSTVCSVHCEEMWRRRKVAVIGRLLDEGNVVDRGPNTFAAITMAPVCAPQQGARLRIPLEPVLRQAGLAAPHFVAAALGVAFPDVTGWLDAAAGLQRALAPVDWSRGRQFVPAPACASDRIQLMSVNSGPGLFRPRLAPAPSFQRLSNVLAATPDLAYRAGSRCGREPKLHLPAGPVTPLASLRQWSSQQSFETIRALPVTDAPTSRRESRPWEAPEPHRTSATVSSGAARPATAQFMRALGASYKPDKPALQIQQTAFVALAGQLPEVAAEASATQLAAAPFAAMRIPTEGRGTARAREQRVEFAAALPQPRVAAEPSATQLPVAPFAALRIPTNGRGAAAVREQRVEFAAALPRRRVAAEPSAAQLVMTPFVVSSGAVGEQAPRSLPPEGVAFTAPVAHPPAHPAVLPAARISFKFKCPSIADLPPIDCRTQTTPPATMELPRHRTAQPALPPPGANAVERKSETWHGNFGRIEVSPRQAHCLISAAAQPAAWVGREAALSVSRRFAAGLDTAGLFRVAVLSSGVEDGAPRLAELSFAAARPVSYGPCERPHSPRLSFSAFLPKVSTVPAAGQCTSETVQVLWPACSIRILGAGAGLAGPALRVAELEYERDQRALAPAQARGETAPWSAPSSTLPVPSGPRSLAYPLATLEAESPAVPNAIQSVPMWEDGQAFSRFAPAPPAVQPAAQQVRLSSNPCPLPTSIAHADGPHHSVQPHEAAPWKAASVRLGLRLRMEYLMPRFPHRKHPARVANPFPVQLPEASHQSPRVQAILTAALRLEEDERWEEAREQYLVALGLEANLPAALAGIGNCYLHCGKPRLAESFFRRARESESSNSRPILSHCGD
jgi:hypothetical protein